MAAGIGINFQCWLSINLQFVWGMVSNSKVIVVIAVKTTLTSNTSLKGENLKHLAISLTIFTHSLPHTNNGMGPTHWPTVKHGMDCGMESFRGLTGSESMF